MAIPLIGELINGVKDIIGEVVVDKDKRDQINFQLKELEDKAFAREAELAMGQIETNKVEAASGSLFVAGWRPAIGWVGATGFAYSFVLQPFFEFISRVNGYTGVMPELPTESLMTLMFGMLGLGGLRAFEKVKGVSTNDLTDVPGRTVTSSTSTEVNVKPTGEITVSKEGVQPPTSQPVKKKGKFLGVF